MTKSRKLPRKAARVTRADIKRFQDLSEHIFGERASDDVVWVCAHIFAKMRALQGLLGPGHAPFELIASAVPLAYKKNWAKNYLGLVERR
jgi:hypothetical protein